MTLSVKSREAERNFSNCK